MNNIQMETAKGLFAQWLKSNQIEHEQLQLYVSPEGKEITFTVK